MSKAYSLDDELFFMSKNDIFDILHNNNEFVIGKEYYEVTNTPLTADVFASDPDFITEQFDSMLYDIVGDTIKEDTFYNATEEAKLDLQELLKSWIEEHIDLSPYSKILGESVTLHVTSDDIKAYKK